MTFRLDELGWQVGVVPALEPSYDGRENVRTTDEAAQARIYGDAIRYLACDASVRSMLFFLLRDEADLDRWQAGLVRADGSRRAVVRRRQGDVRPDRRPLRRPDALLAPLDHGRGREGALPEEARSARAPADPRARRQRRGGRARRRRALPRQARVLRQRSTVKAYRSRIVRFRTRFRPGRYTFRVTLRAAMNPCALEELLRAAPHHE